MFLKVLRIIYQQKINLTAEFFSQKFAIKSYPTAGIPKMNFGKLTYLEGIWSPHIES